LALRDLHHRRGNGSIPAFRRVVIETTGLADPAPLLATLNEMPVVAARYAISGVVTVVDAEHGFAALDRHPEAVKQAAMADRVVITKIDRATPEAVTELEERLERLNPGAQRRRADHGRVDAAWLLESGLYRGDARIPDATGWLNAGAYRRAGPAPHDPRIRAFAWSAAEPLAWESLERALGTLVERFGERILRLKGLANIAGEPGPRAVHAVQHTLYPSARLASWPDADRSTRIVVIGRDLEEAQVTPILESTAWQQPNPRT
jgi:G3E family GTPase